MIEGLIEIFKAEPFFLYSIPFGAIGTVCAIAILAIGQIWEGKKDG